MPVLASVLLKAGQHGEPCVVRLLTARYRKDGQRLARPEGMGHRHLLATAGPSAHWRWIGKGAMPVMDEGDIIVRLSTVPPSSLDESIRLNTRLQRALMEVPRGEGSSQERARRTGAGSDGVESDRHVPRAQALLGNGKSPKAALLDSLRAKLWTLSWCPRLPSPSPSRCG